MLQIAICDDSEKDLRKSNHLIQEYCDAKPTCALTVVTFSQADDLMKALEHGQRFDIYYLDILMPGLNGIELGICIREFDHVAPIIYTTTSPDYAIDAFSVRAYDYLLKPIDRNKLFKTLDELCTQITSTPRKSFPLRSKQGIISIPFHDIIYVELQNRTILITLIDNRQLRSTKLHISFENAVESLLVENQFFQCHKSYIVSLPQIECLVKSSFYMRNGAVIPIAQRSMRVAKKRYMEYFLEKTPKSDIEK